VLVIFVLLVVGKWVVVALHHHVSHDEFIPVSVTHYTHGIMVFCVCVESERERERVDIINNLCKE
jgi:hypothetical protein